MRQAYACERPSWPSECMPSAISQHEIQPVQRFTINEVQSTAGRAICLPFERQAQLSRHPSSSRLQPAEGRAVLAGTQSTGCGSFGSNLSAASMHYSLPTTGPSTLDQCLYPSQQAFRGGSPACMSRVLFCTFTVQAASQMVRHALYAKSKAMLQVQAQASVLVPVSSLPQIQHICTVSSSAQLPCLHKQSPVSLLTHVLNPGLGMTC